MIFTTYESAAFFGFSGSLRYHLERDTPHNNTHTHTAFSIHVHDQAAHVNDTSTQHRITRILQQYTLN